MKRQKNQKNNAFIKSPVCDSKKSKSVKEQESSRLLGGLEIKTSLRKIPLVGPLLF